MGRNQNDWKISLRERANRSDRVGRGLTLFSFAGFTLNPAEATLQREGTTLPLRPKSFDVLHYLVRHPQQLVRREELLEAIWEGLVVTDDSLTQCVVEIRRALNDRARGILRTVLGRGYILDVSVTIARPSAENVSPGTNAPLDKVTGAAPSILWRTSYSVLLELAAGVVPQNPDACGGGIAADMEIPHSMNPHSAAWELYQRGRLYFSRRAGWGCTEVQRYFEQHFALDPDFTAAWLYLAATINLRRRSVHVADAEGSANDFVLPLMFSPVGKVLTLGPHNVEVLLRMAQFACVNNGEERALGQIDRAICNGRNSAVTQAILAAIAFDAGDPLLAIPLLRRALALDPDSAIFRVVLAESLYAAGQLGEAEAVSLRAAELAPGLFPLTQERLTWIKIHQKRYEAARDLAEQLPDGPAKAQADAMLNHIAGDTVAADRSLKRLEGYPPGEGASRLAFVFTFRGNREAAFRWLTTATETLLRSPLSRESRAYLTLWRTSPFLEPLQDDPRWARWLAGAKRALYGETDLQVLGILREHVAGDERLPRQSADQ